MIHHHIVKLTSVDLQLPFLEVVHRHCVGAASGGGEVRLVLRQRIDLTPEEDRTRCRRKVGRAHHHCGSAAGWHFQHATWEVSIFPLDAEQEVGSKASAFEEGSVGGACQLVHSQEEVAALRRVAEPEYLVGAEERRGMHTLWMGSKCTQCGESKSEQVR